MIGLGPMPIAVQIGTSQDCRKSIGMLDADSSCSLV